MFNCNNSCVVSSFIDKYVDLKLTKESKRDLNLFIATYYSSKLLSLKKEYLLSEDVTVLNKGLAKYEKNIRYCLQSLFDIDYY